MRDGRDYTVEDTRKGLRFCSKALRRQGRQVDTFVLPRSTNKRSTKIVWSWQRPASVHAWIRSHDFPRHLGVNSSLVELRRPLSVLKCQAWPKTGRGLGSTPRTAEPRRQSVRQAARTRHPSGLPSRLESRPGTKKKPLLHG